VQTLFSEMQSVWEHLARCEDGVASATASSWQQQSPWYRESMDNVSTNEDLLERTLLQAEEAKMA
jgi:hypothetical protein